MISRIQMLWGYSRNLRLSAPYSESMSGDARRSLLGNLRNTEIHFTAKHHRLRMYNNYIYMDFISK